MSLKIPAWGIECLDPSSLWTLLYTVRKDTYNAVNNLDLRLNGLQNQFLHSWWVYTVRIMLVRSVWCLFYYFRTLCDILWQAVLLLRH